MLYAHRVAFWLAHGWWPPVVRHSCDWPPCCNPLHLLAGTVADNNADMHRRGRARFADGEAAAAAKLTSEQVAAIRALYAPGVVTLQVLADEYGVSKPTISRIINGKRWKHLSDTAAVAG